MRTSTIVMKVLHFVFSILILVLIVFALFKVGTAAFDFGYRVFTEPALENAPGRDVTVEIKQDMSAMDIGKLLEEKQLVDNALLFTVQLKTSAYANSIRSGIYTLNTSQKAREMMQIMAKEESGEETE